ncbi:MAG: endonuclease MutS2, partial [Lachnospiraceae bacterium]|nr:endonuclease MutS2 [Lachnospiraceae bacterium]
MNKKVLRTLEYEKIIKQLTDFAGTPSGKELCRRLEPMTDLGEILACIRQTSDAESRIIEKGSVSFGGTCDIRASAKRLDIGSSLSASELLAIGRTLGAAARVKAYGRRDDDAPSDSLDDYFRSLEPLTPLRQEIERCIISDEEISDDASPGLRRIRRGIKTANDRIHTQLNSIINSSRNLLSDGVVTMRDGRYCVPVRMEYSRGFPGLVHDHSSSGSTVFIEPMAVVQLNNEIRELEIEERKEIEAILSNLSNEAAAHSDALVTDFEVLTELDFIFARAALGKSYKGTEPIFNDELKISIKQGRHPLLDPKTVVPIDVSLGIDFDLLVITGPNTGGKTVTLKTIGLLTLMGQSGLLIPAGINSHLSVFNEIFADIGDEQSIEQSLSTFSSHMMNIVNIFRHADSRSLVLVDELGAGTDPTEGAALAIAILDRLHRQGIRTAATTHYSELKVYALSTKGVQNASCEFDVATLRPTYRLLIGIPGKSNAFAISARLGLPED